MTSISTPENITEHKFDPLLNPCWSLASLSILTGERHMIRIINNKTTSPSFLRADSRRGAAELTIARRKLGLVV